MNQKEIIEQLKERVANDKVAKDVCYVWAMRQRARAQVTTQGLAQRMKEEKLEHSESQYNDFLHFISDLGLGKFHRVGKGKAKLTDIAVTLQSIGAAAVGNTATLDGFKKRIKYVRLSKRSARRSTDVIQKLWAAPETKSVVSLGYSIGSKVIYIPVPKELTPVEVSELVIRLQSKVNL